MTLIAAVILIAVIIGIVMVIKNRPTSTPDTLAADTPPPGPAGDEDEVRPILEALLKLNILIRTDMDFSKDLTIEIEAIMDDLMVVIPAMIERYPGETLTYEIKKIGREHLFKTVKEYLDLSGESRSHQFDMFKQTIDALKDVTHRSRDIVEKNETAEFKTMANFLSSKFS